MTRTLLCLHGMACTGRVWDGLAAIWTEGPVLAPDLAGHGAAPRLDVYGIDAYADELVDRIGPQLRAADHLIVTGHSMGGVVGASLARYPELGIEALVAAGVKTDWSADEIAGMDRVADKGVRWFDERSEAESWFLKVSGLTGLVDPGSAVAASGVVSEDGRWRLAADPEAYRSAPPPFADQLAVVTCPVRLGRGRDDEMVPPEQVRPFDADFVEFPDSGHSPHVEQPAQLAAAIRSFIA